MGRRILREDLKSMISSLTNMLDNSGELEYIYIDVFLSENSRKIDNCSVLLDGDKWYLEIAKNSEEADIIIEYTKKAASHTNWNASNVYNNHLVGSGTKYIEGTGNPNRFTDHRKIDFNEFKEKVYNHFMK